MSYIGNAPIIVADAITPITASASANGSFIVTDTTGYNSISIQITGDWEADAVFQTSNDNVNWVNVQGYAQNSGLVSIDTVADNDIYLVPVIGRYFQVLVSGYITGTLSIVAYLRSQSLAGIGEGMLTQALDDVTGVAQNVKFPSNLLGQQASRTSVPVALANEQINDLNIIGRVYNTAQAAIPVNTNLILDPALVAAGRDPTSSTDCLQYRSISLQFNQTTLITGGTVVFEASNDNVNWVQVPLYAGSTGGYGSQTSTFNWGTGGGANNYYDGPITYRWFRARCSSAAQGGSSTIQCSARLSMSPWAPKYSQSGVDLQRILGVSPAGVGVAVTQNPITIGGQDAQSLARRILTDSLGAVSVTGTLATAAEYSPPVQVQEFRSTRGQESTQDLLTQILLELKAFNYYVRELPTAIATMSQLPNPQSAAAPASMQDEPESFYTDPNVLNNKNG